VLDIASGRTLLLQLVAVGKGREERERELETHVPDIVSVIRKEFV